ncbi:MAG: LapA family protein [Alphaproteobacteria bacterium]|nr:LapA family protein [Alphaproteobacteria bacterium]
MRLISWLISLPIFAAVIVFILQNRFQVPISFWPFDLEITLPVSILSLGVLILGFIMGSIVTGFTLFRSQIEARSLRNQVANLNKQLDEKTPLSCEPIILYNGRYQTISTIEKTTPSSKKKRWFGR